jgi:hypothetical protein
MSALDKIAKTASPRLRALVLGAALVFGLCAYAGVTAAHPLRHAHRAAHAGHRPKLFLSVSPGKDTILAGSTAGYRIRIRRRWFTGAVRLRVTGGLPPGASARFSPRVLTRWRSALTIHTSRRTAPGTYRVRLRARRGRVQRTAVVTLTIGGGGDGGNTTAVALPDYQVSGNVVDPLWPGMPRAIDLTISNPNPLPLSLTGLTVSITSITAPRATAVLPCSSSDFTVQQYSGAYPVVVPASSTASLQELGIPSSAWPQLAIIDLPTDQDGCQGASLTLAYSGQATLG